MATLSIDDKIRIMGMALVRSENRRNLDEPISETYRELRDLVAEVKSESEEAA